MYFLDTWAPLRKVYVNYTFFFCWNKTFQLNTTDNTNDIIQKPNMI